MRVRWASMVLLMVCGGWGCFSSQRAPREERSASGLLTVYVVNYPLQYFAERIGGERVRVVLPAPSTGDPAFWTPGPEDIAAYQQADVILLSGASYAKWTKTAALPQTRIVDTSASVAERYIEVEDAVSHSHGPGGAHVHAGTASSVWLDPQLAVAQAKAISQTLMAQRPQYQEEFKKNFAALEADLNKLESDLSKATEGKSDRPLLFSHPVYQYLQRRYGLNAKSVLWEPGELPSEKRWDELRAMLEQHPAKWMVWEGPPNEESVRRLEELGVRSVIFDPCSNKPAEDDFLSIMQRNVENLSRALTE